MRSGDDSSIFLQSFVPRLFKQEGNTQMELCRSNWSQLFAGGNWFWMVPAYIDNFYQALAINGEGEEEENDKR